MRDILAEINAGKREEIRALKNRISLPALEEAARAAGPLRGFAEQLRQNSQSGYGLIAELKKASPSKGLIRADFNRPALARAYAEGGASCLSVLTDEPWFQGSAAYLKEAREAVSLPVLRKDFMLEPVQITESRAMGADCILLIMASLSDSQANELEQTAIDWGMDILIEVHDEAELERACALRSPLMGINARNLKTMDISLDHAASMLGRLPEDRIAIAESGLHTPEDLARMASCGARCFLIGESLMRQPDLAAATARLLANPVAAGSTA